MSIDPTPATSAEHALVVVLSSGSVEAAQLALRYASTAAAMDLTVELHVVGAAAVGWLERGAAPGALLAKLNQAVEFGVGLFACPAALAERGLHPEQLIAAVAGIRGAASLLEATLAPNTRVLSF